MDIGETLVEATLLADLEPGKYYITVYALTAGGNRKGYGNRIITIQ